MKDDLLARTTRALRDRPDADAAGDLGLRRLERGLADGARQRTRSRGLTLLVAASLVGITAWAGASGRLPQWLRVGTSDQQIGQHDQRVEHAVGQSATPRAPSLDAIPSVDAIPSAPLPAAPTRPLANGPPASAPRPPSFARPVARPAAPQDLDALYREAHEAHFVRRDPQAALDAWDRYLAAAGPNGRMTLEARYSRAIDLVRLGRKDEARAALEPFARGEYGGYRRDEATRLLDSLR